jgi:hypothetical protein
MENDGVADFFPGHSSTTSVAPPVDEQQKRKQEVISKYFHDNVVSTFQSTAETQQRKERLRMLKHIGILERKVLVRNQESQLLQDQITDLKVCRQLTPMI